MKNKNGQILLPGLALLWALMMMFLALVVYGRHVLMQMRMNMAAEATALSAARAQAEMLNKYASYNMALNPLLPKWDHYAAVQVWAEEALVAFALYQRWYQLPQFQIFPRNVGRRVAKDNGCDANPKYIPTLSGLDMQDVEAIPMWGIYPTSLVPVELRNMYYARTWGSGKRKVQPPHKTHWLVSKDGVHATASARLYLDVQADEKFQNGGFPSVDSEHLWDDAGIQSLYPQFNARLLDRTPLGLKKILEHL